jgi:hypothetical protein
MVRLMPPNHALSERGHRAAGGRQDFGGRLESTGRNLYIRARGYYHGARENGSESIQESVRQHPRDLFAKLKKSNPGKLTPGESAFGRL